MSDQPFPLPIDEEEYISFHAEDFDFALSDELAQSSWLQKVIEDEGYHLKQLSYIFCSDNYLHQINLEYLDHDTFTDIITFPYEEAPFVGGDIFISIERVRENAKEFKVPFEQELGRVMAHGVLHLCGYKDKTPEQQMVMRQKEEESLSKRKSFID